MANGDRFFGPVSFSGEVASTGAAISVSLDFKPIAIQLVNATTGASLFWFYGMGDDKGYKIGIGAAGGNTGSTSGGTPAGTVSAPTFTGTSPVSSLDLATPAFSGTGLTAAGQVITTTDNQTMTLNQCAGMWLLSATGATPPNLILSNTAVAGAPAVLTVQGSANTDAGAYKIVKSLTPVGTNSAPTFTGSALATHLHTFAGGGGGSFIATGGITVGNSGFYIGTDADINPAGAQVIYVKAFRSMN